MKVSDAPIFAFRYGRRNDATEEGHAAACIYACEASDKEEQRSMLRRLLFLRQTPPIAGIFAMVTASRRHREAADTARPDAGDRCRRHRAACDAATAACT